MIFAPVVSKDVKFSRAKVKNSKVLEEKPQIQ